LAEAVPSPQAMSAATPTMPLIMMKPPMALRFASEPVDADAQAIQAISAKLEVF
jgi:hypothetical protein